jgi:hypothetical protein
MTRRCGRSTRGARCRAPVPHGRWKPTTLVGALRTRGMTGPMGARRRYAWPRRPGLCRAGPGADTPLRRHRRHGRPPGLQPRLQSRSSKTADTRTAPRGCRGSGGVLDPRCVHATGRGPARKHAVWEARRCGPAETKAGPLFERLTQRPLLPRSRSGRSRRDRRRRWWRALAGPPAPAIRSTPRSWRSSGSCR